MGRTIRTIALFLLGGAIMTVAVAWACAALVLVKPGAVGFSSVTRVAHLGDEKWSSVYECKALGTRRMFSMRDTDFYFDYTTTVMVDEAQLFPGWARQTAAGRHDSVAVHEARGLPLQAMSCEIMTRGGREWRTAPSLGGIALTPSSQGFAVRSRALPLRPIWPAFAADSMFYAAILLVSVRGPGAVRRLVRNRSGRCVACGYDLRGERSHACPECGT